MKKIAKIFYTFVAVFGIFISQNIASAQNKIPDSVKLNPGADKEFINIPGVPNGIFEDKNIDNPDGLIGLLGFIQSVLLKLVLPLVAIGCGLYIAYLLFTAEGDESKMKSVWKAVVYSIVGMISIMLSYFVVDLIARINIA